MTQQATLDTSEVYHLQFDVLRQATGQQMSIVPQRPQNFLYPTFESRLPLTWNVSKDVITFDIANCVAEDSLPKRKCRPVLLCKFCSHVKTYATSYGFWSHIFHKHIDVSNSERLEEIRRSASLWWDYWVQDSDGGRGNAA